MIIILIPICVDQCAAMKTETQPSIAKPKVPRSPAVSPRSLDSAALLGGRGEVEIAHQDETYRLRRARQGKLILAK